MFDYALDGKIDYNTLTKSEKFDFVKDYTARQAKYTLLYKKKINKITGKVETQYNKLTDKSHGVELGKYQKTTLNNNGDNPKL